MKRGVVVAVLVFPVLACGCSRKPNPEKQPPSVSAAAAAGAGGGARPVAATPSASSARPPIPRVLAHSSPAWGDQGRPLPPNVGIPVGQVIPDVAGIDSDGKTVRLREMAKQHAPLVIIFYRGGFCGFASYFLEAIRVQDKAFRDSGAHLVFISPDTPDKVALTKAGHELSWPMLSDADLSITKAFRLEHSIDERDLADAEKYKMELPVLPNGEKATLSNPGLFIVDATGKVKFAHADTRSDMYLAYSQILDGIRRAAAAK